MRGTAETEAVGAAPARGKAKRKSQDSLHNLTPAFMQIRLYVNVPGEPAQTRSMAGNRVGREPTPDACVDWAEHFSRRGSAALLGQGNCAFACRVCRKAHRLALCKLPELRGA